MYMQYKLSVKKREIKGEKMRSRSVIPAVVYGAGKEPISLSLDYNTFVKLNKQVGSSSLIDLSIDEQEVGKILIHDIQYNPVTDLVEHVDLRFIDMNKEITATVPLVFVGESSAIKEQGGNLLKNVNDVEVKCLPKDLISEIKVDLSILKTFDDVIKVKDLPVPESVVITSPDGEGLVAKAAAALSEDQLKAIEDAEAADVSEVEVSGEKKEEGEDEAGGEKKEEGKKEEGKEDGKDEKKKDK